VGCFAALLLGCFIANSALLCKLVRQIVPCRFFCLLLYRGVPGFVARLVQPKRALFWLAVWHFGRAQTIKRLVLANYTGTQPCFCPPQWTDAPDPPPAGPIRSGPAALFVL
jgi:hypothetical protein